MIEKIFIVDDFVMIGRKKFMLNLNVYRNSHFQSLSDAKIQFTKDFILEHRDFLKNKFQSVKITYTIIPHNKVMFDIQNVLSIVDKFFCDALVKSGIIPDDNYTCVSYGEPAVTEIVKGKNKIIKIFCEFF
jgi:hypothetical protein